eukprot:jgi/Botrbrau1/14424/Bobra.0014s0071.1
MWVGRGLYRQSGAESANDVTGSTRVRLEIGFLMLSLSPSCLRLQLRMHPDPHPQLPAHMHAIQDARLESDAYAIQDAHMSRSRHMRVIQSGCKARVGTVECVRRQGRRYVSAEHCVVSRVYQVSPWWWAAFGPSMANQFVVPVVM